MTRAPRRRLGPPVDVHRLGVFVPAIMSVGVTFWLAALARDAVRWRVDELREQRSTISGRRLAASIRPGQVAQDADRLGFRHRSSYLVTAAFLYSVSTYVFFGGIVGYNRAGGFVEGDAWLLGPAMLASLAGALVGSAAFATWARWPSRSRWSRVVVASTPLSRLPLDRLGPGARPSWRVSAAVLILLAGGLMVTILVASETVAVEWVDERLAQLLDVWELDELESLDPIGSTTMGLALAGVVGISTLRCRPLAVAYPVAVLAGLGISTLTKAILERPRPPDGPFGLQFDSFPSGHLIQATVIAGLFPLAVAALSGNRRMIWPIRFVLGLGVFGSALHRIDEDLHWASDAVASLFFGLALVVFVQWIIEHENWHAWCRGCPWGHEEMERPTHGILHVHVDLQRFVRGAAHLWAAGAVILLTYLSVTRGVPSHADGAGFGEDVQVPVQLGLAGVASLGALVAWKSEAVGAVLLALAGSGLGIFAALEYAPVTAFGLTVFFVVPAVLLWLTWQHERSMTEIIALATTASVLLGASWAGATWVNDTYFGPSHPPSTAIALPSDRVEWMWMGGLSSSSIVVVAGLDDDHETARLILTDAADGTVVRSGVQRAAPTGSVRLTVDGLAADRDYQLVVEVDGTADRSRGTGSFRTAPDDAGSFRFVVGSCARTGSNGGVFDAMLAEDPLFYMALGDLHYQNIAADDPARYRQANARLLRRPGQAQLYRSVPISYVWDDHDYGPNDSDAGSPGRGAARTVYREMVPHHPLAEAGDGPIHHAYTLGRVRFVLTDSRSERTDDSILGDDQMDWLIDEIVTSSRTHGLVIWGNPVPWVGDGGSRDSWAGRPEERRRIADALVDAGVDNLVMLSGDAHMVALDDGTNTGYSTTGEGGFPLLHAGALDRPGTVKGGPYSDGAFPGGGQYGVVDVDDRGDAIDVTLSGRTWDGTTLVSRTFTFETD